MDLGFLYLGKFYYTSICDLSPTAEARISVVSQSSVTATEPQDQIGSVSNGCKKHGSCNGVGGEVEYSFTCSEH